MNSTATLFAYDIFRRWRPRTTDHRLVVIGKITTVVATVAGHRLSPLFSRYPTIYEGLVSLICYLAPPITAVFLLGRFLAGASGQAAYLDAGRRGLRWGGRLLARVLQGLGPAGTSPP